MGKSWSIELHSVDIQLISQLQARENLSDCQMRHFSPRHELIVTCREHFQASIELLRVVDHVLSRACSGVHSICNGLEQNCFEPGVIFNDRTQPPGGGKNGCRLFSTPNNSQIHVVVSQFSSVLIIPIVAIQTDRNRDYQLFTPTTIAFVYIVFVA